MQVATGSYAGNNADNRAITGVGFQPDLVIIQSQDSQHPIVKTSAMAGDTALGSSTTLTANLIQSLDADGFTVGSDSRVNSGTYSFYWIAMRAAAGEMAVGNYTGDGADNRAITGVGFLPEFVMVLPATGTDSTSWRTSQHSGDASQYVNSAGAPFANFVQSLDADGFTVGSASPVNKSGGDIHWFAIKSITGYSKSGSYTGTGADDYSLSGFGFQPAWFFSQADAASRAYHKTSEMGTGAHRFGTAQSLTDNIIQAIESDGVQLGTATGGNVNTVVYRWFAIKAGSSPSGGSAVPVIMNQYRQRWN